jgi:hypothetical protein
VYHNRTALAHLFDQLVQRYPHLATLVDITAKLIGSALSHR